MDRFLNISETINGCIFNPNVKKTLCEHDKTCWKWFARLKSADFHLDDKERLGQSKGIECEEMEDLLEENSYRTLQELSTSLEVDLFTISKRLKALRMIQK